MSRLRSRAAANDLRPPPPALLHQRLDQPLKGLERLIADLAAAFDPSPPR